MLPIRQFRLTKWSFLVHSSTHNAPDIHPSHDLILELWRTFLNGHYNDLFDITQIRYITIPCEIAWLLYRSYAN